MDRNRYFVSASIINHENDDNWETHENDLLCNMYVAVWNWDKEGTMKNVGVSLTRRGDEKCEDLYGYLEYHNSPERGERGREGGRGGRERGREEGIDGGRDRRRGGRIEREREGRREIEREGGRRGA